MAKVNNDFTTNLIDMYAALDGGSFLDAAMRVIQFAAPGIMVSWKCQFLGMRGFRMDNDQVTEVSLGTIERCYKEHREFLTLPRGAKIIQSPGIAPAGGLRLPCENCTHAVTLCFWEGTAKHTPDCMLSIHREAPEAPFSQTELDSLASLHSQIARARKRLERIEAQRSALHSLEVLVRKLPLAALVLDWEVQLVFANAAGREDCARWTSGAEISRQPRCGPPVPGDIRDICVQMKAEWTNGIQSTERILLREVAHPTEVGRHARISMIPLGVAQPGRPSFLLQFINSKETAAAGQRSDGGLATLTELTPEERAVAREICEGKSNDEISSALGKSVFTVKRQVYSIFRKLRISNRTQLAMRLLP